MYEYSVSALNSYDFWIHLTSRVILLAKDDVEDRCHKEGKSGKWVTPSRTGSEIANKCIKGTIYGLHEQFCRSVYSSYVTAYEVDNKKGIFSGK